MNTVALLPVLVPLGCAALLLLTRPARRIRQVALVAALLGQLAAASVLLAHVAGGQTITLGIGGWPGGIAIPLVIDALAGLMVTTTSLVALLVACFAIVSGAAEEPY
ncbi:MAG: monovalent cation/H+ antiporter subunit D family protein, partial [Luteococcus japonicus]